MNYSIAKIRAALQYHADCDCEKAQEALTTLAELEKAAGEPVAYQYAHPYFGGGKIWREEQRWNGHTSDEARALYTTPPPAKPAPGMFTADEMEAAWRDAYANGDNTEASRSNQDFWWPRSATFKLIQERTQ